MRLISLYIENYGKFTRTEYAFSPFITEFCEDNGYGKTTLASFLKAMFYGLPSYTARSKAFSDRERYYPYYGGKFGGNLRFEWQGREYRIERFFDKKSEAKDECRVFCGNALTDEFKGGIGRTVFGLDEESFERTAFFTANDGEICSTGGIDRKLNRFVENTDGDGDFVSAIAALEKASKTLKAMRGNNDLISRQKEKIFALKSRIADLKTVENGLGELYRERKTLATELKALAQSEREEIAVQSKIELLKSQTENAPAPEKPLRKRRLVGVLAIAILFLLDGVIELALGRIWGLLGLSLGALSACAVGLLFRKTKSPKAERQNELASLERKLESLNGGAGEEIREISAQKTRALARLDERIFSGESEVARLPELLELLENEEELLESYETRYALLNKTKAALEAAEKRLKDKYIKPMKEGFTGYAETVEKTLGEKMQMDENFRLTFERGGELKSDGHLSAGQRAVADLCFRLALIDNLYESEPPFLILDDPFVKLDETHFGRVRKVLRAISEEKQIVYFCCHESRKIK